MEQLTQNQMKMVEKILKQIIPIIVEGGIGDLLISLPLIQHYLFNDNFQINLYSSFPEIAKYFLPKVETFFSIQYFRRDKNDFDFSISISDMIYFYKKPDKKLPEYLEKYYQNWLNLFPEWEKYLTKHPFHANEMAKKAVLINQKRWLLPFYFLGVFYRPFELKKEIKSSSFPKKFITIHDGFDATNYYKFERSMKSWSLIYWEKFVELFKKQYPDILIVQLGGIKHQKIKKVDINFAGQLSFEKSLEFLNGSLLHVDGDSGLVHARHLLKKQSIVIFGATSIDYFGYSANSNIAPNFCGNCWWLKSDWMAKCMKNFDTPKCMDSVTPEQIINVVNKNFGSIFYAE